MAWDGRRPPERIETERLVLARTHVGEADELTAAANASTDALRPYVPWAHDLPHTVEQTRASLELRTAAFDADESYTYTIRGGDSGAVLGGCGLFPRIGAGGLEIGYWVRSNASGRGIATEAAGALVDAGFASGADHLELHIDRTNTASLRIPAKLGFDRVDDTPEGLLVFRRLREA